MIKGWSKFNEELDIKSGARTTQVPHREPSRLSPEELEKMKGNLNKSDEERSKKVDPYFIQEITDRILGPDSEEYVRELEELNAKYRSRVSKTGRGIYEGRTEKASKEKDSDVKLEDFRTKVKDFLKGKDCKVKQVGDDFEVHFDGEHVAQVMFRKDKMTVKKEGDKFGKDFKYTQLGDVKKELTSLLK